jgi:hypothetical protein
VANLWICDEFDAVRVCVLEFSGKLGKTVTVFDLGGEEREL